MRDLYSAADYVLPNYTEAAFSVGIDTKGSSISVVKIIFQGG